ncbi:hypothetical protein DFH07DRAFT_962989 [Mycena maculata]|uniref:Uncharacterized protein n=1 Tax=Mycena maculata TaxID=230809 RepID=A0AAD7N5A1_9AGAR|nr:hypothetical protein DFH07DRAFT_962989 [Mycena maculata]
MPVAVNDGDHGPRDVPKTAVKEVLTWATFDKMDTIVIYALEGHTVSAKVTAKVL